MEIWPQEQAFTSVTYRKFQWNVQRLHVYHETMILTLFMVNALNFHVHANINISLCFLTNLRALFCKFEFVTLATSKPVIDIFEI